MPTPDPTPKKRPGRPALAPEDRVKNKRSRILLDGPIPRWIGYEDLKALIKQYRGRMYDERKFKLWVEDGDCPSAFDSRAVGTAHPGVRRRAYEWAAVRAWIDEGMVPAPRAGIMVNGELRPRKKAC